MNGSLFRPEVFEAKRNSWLGGISLVQPLRLWVLAVAVFAMATAIVCFLVFGEYSRRSRVDGQLVPDLGLSTVVAPSSGVVARLFQEEGDRVRAGDSLVLIDAPRSTASGLDAVARTREILNKRRTSTEQLGRSQAAQIDAQLAGQSRQLTEAEHELLQIERQIETRREQVRIGRETVQRYRSILDEQYVSQVQLNQQQQSVLELLNQQQALEREATSIRRSIAQLRQSLRELPTQRNALQATIQRDVALLDQERLQQSTASKLLVKAPLAALVTNRLIEPGQSVQAGQPLLNLLPQGSKLQAQLLVPSRAVGFIEPGDRVRLRYQAFPYQKFGHHAGKVLRISRSAITPESSKNAEPYYRVLVALDQQTILAHGKMESLRPGMLLDADILGERRKLYEWVLEPIYSLKGQVAVSSAQTEQIQSSR